MALRWSYRATPIVQFPRSKTLIKVNEWRPYKWPVSLVSLRKKLFAVHLPGHLSIYGTLTAYEVLMLS